MDRYELVQGGRPTTWSRDANERHQKKRAPAAAAATTWLASYAQARFPFKRNRLRCVRRVLENRKKRKRLRWQAANRGYHCFDRSFLLAGACVCCVKFSRNKPGSRGPQAWDYVVTCESVHVITCCMLPYIHFCVFTVIEITVIY